MMAPLTFPASVTFSSCYFSLFCPSPLTLKEGYTVRAMLIKSRIHVQATMGDNLLLQIVNLRCFYCFCHLLSSPRHLNWTHCNINLNYYCEVGSHPLLKGGKTIKNQSSPHHPPKPTNSPDSLEALPCEQVLGETMRFFADISLNTVVCLHTHCVKNKHID